MEFILDDLNTERLFQQLLKDIKRLKNGVAVDAMAKQGVVYNISWGVSIPQLRQLSKRYGRDHLLALKLWNKGWRESMILATMLEEVDKMDERQMDFWVKTMETTELIDQAVFNLFASSKYAFVKAMEYCCGKKHLVNYAGIQLMGRLARVDDRAINDMFEIFFTKLPPLTRDPRLKLPLYNGIMAIAQRNSELKLSCVNFLNELLDDESENSRHLAQVLLDEFSYC